MLERFLFLFFFPPHNLLYQFSIVKFKGEVTLVRKKEKKNAKAIFLMIVGESPVKEMAIQLKACFSNLKKPLVFKNELIFSLDCGQVGIKFDSSKLCFPSNTISF